MEQQDYQLSELQAPHSLEAEQTVLGAVLVRPDVLPEVLDRIHPESFFSPQHQTLFRVMVRLFSMGTPADIVTVLNEAMRAGVFETEQEGRTYLAALVNEVPSAANVGSYCDIVEEKHYLRMLGDISRSLLQDIASGGSDAQTLLDSAEQRIFDIRQGRDVRGLVPLSEVVVEAYERIGKLAGPDRDQYVGARTGFSMLDLVTSGLNRSDLILIAARPGMGKTSFAMNIAVNVARRSEQKVAIFSLEMSREQLATRLLASEALVDSNKLRSGRLSGDDWTRLASSADVLGNLPIYIDESAGITVQQIKAKLRRMRGVGLVIIDYLQLMQSSLKTDNRVLVISEITRQLKILAKELDIPVILLSQLNRSVESRPDKRPMLSDLRESGSIEQDADIVMFLYRDAYYNKESETPNLSECIVAKNRHGETSTVELVWDGQFTRFSSTERES